MTLVTMASAMAMTVSRMTVPSMEERVTFRPTLAKKDGGEEHVGEGLTLGVDIDGPGGVGDHQAGEEGADDIRHAEDLLRHIGIEEAESQEMTAKRFRFQEAEFIHRWISPWRK